MFKVVEKTKNFDKVTRIKAINEEGLMIETDVHDTFFDILKEKFNLKIEKKNKFEYDHDYIMRGNIFKKTDTNTFVSFNGLLMQFDNSLNNDLKEGEEIYTYFDN